jgi:CubicO group peptidase (beta-lactamase class C family)
MSRTRFLPVLTCILFGIPAALAAAEDQPLAEQLRPLVTSGRLAGAVVLVATPEKVLDVEAVGYADIAGGVSMPTNALFWIASMNKPITATALMMLVDEGKIALDDPVEKYLPEFRGQLRLVDTDGTMTVLRKPAHPVTVREILSHTAGLVGRSPLERELDTVSIREGAISYGLSPLKFEPGTKYEYCNPGINTVGRLVEVVSGIPYETFLQERLFDPLKMTDTTFWPDEAQLKRLAKSYKPGPKNEGLVEEKITQLSYPLSDRKRHPYPAGGLFSTAKDLATFCRMIASGGTLDGRRYVSEKSVRAMASTQTGDLLNGGKGEGGYGLGWSTSRKSKGDAGPVIPGSFSHGGAYATHMEIDPERKLILIFMVQHAGWPGPDGNQALPTFHKAARELFAK